MLGKERNKRKQIILIAWNAFETNNNLLHDYLFKKLCPEIMHKYDMSV